MGNLTKDFNSSDFECSCGCSKSKMNRKTVERLQTLKDVLGIELKITKGYVCEDSSKVRRNVNTEGKAIELKLKQDSLHLTINVAMSIGFTGIGIKFKNGQNLLHLDDAEDIVGKRARPSFWVY